MSYKYQRIVFSIVVIATLISCNKNNELPQFEGQYKNSTEGIITPVIMFTKQGQVTDITTIQGFLQRKGFTNEFIFNSSSISIPTGLSVLTISENNTVSILTNGSSTILQGEIIDKTSSELTIAAMDSTKYYIMREAGRCDTFSIGISNSKRKFYPLSSFSGYKGFYKFRRILPLKINNGQLIMPLMKSLVSSSNGGSSCYVYFRDYWDSFNSDIPGQLMKGDTIVYQINEVPLVRQ